MDKKILYIDAGHGGLDSEGNYTTLKSNGKRFLYNNGKEYHSKGYFYEGVFNREFAKYFIAIATQNDYLCIPVYHYSKDNSLESRVHLANTFYYNFDYQGTYLSFHSNAFNSNARGFNLFHHPNSTKGKELAQAICPDIQKVFVENGSVSKFPVRADNFYVLRETKMTSLLFEFGFFDNEDDANLLMDKSFVFDVAYSLLNSLDNNKKMLK
jgi:N-acetylmuramoyl-L-alanine amidase